MSDQNTAVFGEVMPWPCFLASCPPGQVRKVSSLRGERSTDLSVPAVELYCDSEKCGGVRFFDSRSSGSAYQNHWSNHFLIYSCRHCGQRYKTFAVRVLVENEVGDGQATKYGEWPAFAPHVPTKVFSLVGEDQELFLKGRRAEAQGMGIGAFAYYRRVVENQKNRLIDEIIKVSRRLDADEQIIAKLELARNETQFHKAVQIVKDAIPDMLRISGHNPLTLLHTALSDGLHGKSDEECLVRATSIRLVLAELSERIVQALKDHAELNEAVSKLLQIQSGPPKSRQAPAGDPQKAPTT